MEHVVARPLGLLFILSLLIAGSPALADPPSAYAEPDPQTYDHAFALQAAGGLVAGAGVVDALNEGRKTLQISHGAAKAEALDRRMRRVDNELEALNRDYRIHTDREKNISPLARELKWHHGPWVAWDKKGRTKKGKQVRALRALDKEYREAIDAISKRNAALQASRRAGLKFVGVTTVIGGAIAGAGAYFEQSAEIQSSAFKVKREPAEAVAAGSAESPETMMIDAR